MDIAQIRKEYPQYSDLSDDQVAKGLHQKFYSDIPFDQFTKKIGLKADKSGFLAPIKSVAGMVGNHLAGGISGAADIGSTAISALQHTPTALALEAMGVDTGRSGGERRTAVTDFLKGLGADTESNAFAGGKFGTHMAGTAALGGPVANTVSRIPGVAANAPNFVNAIRGVTAPVFNRAATATVPAVTGGGVSALAANAGGGAVTGAAMSAAVNPDDALMGAGVGSAATVVLPAALKALGTGAGKVWDILTGEFGPVRAAKILNQVAGTDANALKAAASVGGPDLTTAQATAGVKNDKLNALSALAVKNDGTGYFRDVAERQAQSRIDDVARIAGGANQAEAIANRKGTSDTLNALVKPMYNAELGAANTAGTTGRRLENEAARMGDAAASKVEDVRRLSKAGQTAEDLANSGRMRLDGQAPPVPGLPRISGRYSYGTDLANRAEGAAQRAADDSLILGDASRLAQYERDSIAAHGLKPVDTTRLVANLRGKLNNPSAAGDENYAKIMSKVADDVAEWTKRGGGQIDAEALYAIKKNSVKNAIDILLNPLDPKGSAKYAAKVMGDVGPIIDKAITDAGATGWSDLLKTVAQGKQQLNQQELGAHALKLLQKTPNAFEDLVANNSPKVVRKIFGGEVSIDKAMGDKVIPMRRVADELARDRGIAEGAKRGSEALDTILQDNHLSSTLPYIMNAKVGIMNKGLRMIDKTINRSTENALYAAMRSGDSFNEAMAKIPMQERSKVIKALRASGGNPMLRAGSINAIQSLQGNQ